MLFDIFEENHENLKFTALPQPAKNDLRIMPKLPWL